MAQRAVDVADHATLFVEPGSVVGARDEGIVPGVHQAAEASFEGGLEAGGGLYVQTAAELGLSPDELDADQSAYEAIRAACRRLDLEVVDPLEELQAAFGRLGTPLYYSSDWHLNPVGHRELAGILFRIVETDR